MIVPFVLAALEDTFQAVMLALGIAAVLMVITSKRVRIMARVVNRWITSWFVNLDPISIREDHIQETLKRKNEAAKAVGSIRGLRDGLSRRYAVNQAEYSKTSSRLKTAASVMATPGASAESVNQAQRSLTRDSPYLKGLQETLEGQQSQLRHYEDAITKLNRLLEMCDDIIVRKQNEIRLEKDHQEEAKALRKVRGFMAAVFGKTGDVGEEMDEMAREALEREYSEEIGQFDQYLNDISGVIAQSDFNNLAAVQEVQERLSKANAAPMPVVNTTPRIAAAAVAISIPQPKQKETVQDDYFK